MNKKTTIPKLLILAAVMVIAAATRPNNAFRWNMHMQEPAKAEFRQFWKFDAADVIEMMKANLKSKGTNFPAEGEWCLHAYPSTEPHVQRMELGITFTNLVDVYQNSDGDTAVQNMSTFETIRTEGKK